MILSTLLVVLGIHLAEQAALSENNVDLIIGGENATTGEAPYQVAMFRPNQDTAYCSGSIISRRTVVTAAHCIKIVENILECTAVAGTNFNSKTSGVSYGIDKVIAHEHYQKPTRFSNDIGLIILDRDVEYTDLIQPIELNNTDHTDPIEAKVTGWGVIDKRGGTPSPVLKRLNVETLSREDCKKLKDIVDDNMICTMPMKKSEGLCGGDSGGPVVTKVDQGWQLVGVVSFGSDDCGSGNPDVQTRVSSFVDWIEKNGVF